MIMKKFLLLLWLPVVAVVLPSCNSDKDEPDNSLNTNLIKGTWELTSPDAQGRTWYYDFKTSGQSTFSWGTLTTYCALEGDVPERNALYEWHVTDPANSNPVYLDITSSGDFTGAMVTESYIVNKVTQKEMVLTKTTDRAGEEVLKFKRRNDLLLN